MGTILTFHSRNDYEHAKRYFETYSDYQADEIRDDGQSITFNDSDTRFQDNVTDELDAFGIGNYEID